MEGLDIVKFLTENWRPLVTGITFLGATILGAKKWRVVTKWLLARARGNSINHNTCIVLGQGGTGKTTLIRRITLDPKATPEVETDSFRLHDHRIAIESDDYHLTFADYRGQNLGVLTRGLMQLTADGRQKIASLIVMLDICDTASGLPRERGGPVPDYKHLNRQVNQWQWQAVEAVLGAIDGEQIRLALILVNKIDLLTYDERAVHEKRILVLCKPLQDKLKKSLPRVPVEILLGSAQGASAIDIRDRLVHYAARVRS